MACQSTAAGELQALLAEGRLTKTALAKLKVAALREECEEVGLSAEGTKPELVARLLDWAAASSGQPEQPEQQQQPQQEQERSLPSAQQLQQGEGRGEGGEHAEASTATHAAPEAPASMSPQQQQQQPSGAPSYSQNRRSRLEPRSDVAVTWLGTSSGNPTPRRNVSCIAVSMAGSTFLVDAGEGSHNQLRRGGIDAAGVRAVLITHMHGDHCFGLAGVVNAVCQARLGQANQGEPLLVFGPPEVHALLLAACRTAQLALTTPVVATGWALDARASHPPRAVDPAGMLRFALQGPDQGALPAGLAQQLQEAYEGGNGVEVVQRGLTWSARLPGGVRVAAAQLSHRIPCWGYVFREADQAVPAPAPAPAAGDAGSGSDGEGEGAEAQGQERGPRGPVREQGPAEQAQAQARGQAAQQWVRRGRKLVILGDTCDSSAIAPLARHCDLLSHEATFMAGMEDKAEVAAHSTAEQAGAFARVVAARSLVLTHFSARYGVTVEEQRAAAAARRQLASAARGGGGGRGAGPPPPRAAGREGGQDEEENDYTALLRQACAGFQSDAVYLASDFYTFFVAPRPPQSLRPPPAGQPERRAAGAGGGGAARAAAQQQRRGTGGRPALQQRRQQQLTGARE
eukprot:scaffold10.g2421.t1